MRAFELPNAGALVHLNNVSGGVLAGDKLLLDVELKPGAAAQLTTTGATRLYRHRAGSEDSEQHTNFTVGDNAMLEYLPDAVIPFANSRHRQRTEIHLGTGATLFWWEMLAPGRQASGERFAFERLSVKSEVYAVQRPIMREDYVLEPQRRNPVAMARMHRYTHTASLCAAQQGRPPAFWRELENTLNEIAKQHTSPGDTVWGASMLASDGIVVRGLSTSSCYVHKTLVEFWKAARVAITGVESVPPRKIY